MDTTASIGSDGSTAEPTAVTGTEGTEGTATTVVTPPPGLDKTKLHPVLQGLDEGQVNDLFNTLYSVASRGAAEPVKVVEPAKPAVDNDRIKKLMDPSDPDYNPAAAIGEVVRANVAPVMSDINTRAMVGVEQKLVELYPDFGDLRPDIDKIFSGRDRGTISPQELESGYFVVKGARQAKAERDTREKASKVTTAEPTPSARTSDGKRGLSPDEKSMAKKFYPNLSAAEAEKKYARFADSEPFEVNVPLGGSK